MKKNLRMFMFVVIAGINPGYPQSSVPSALSSLSPIFPFSQSSVLSALSSLNPLFPKPSVP